MTFKPAEADIAEMPALKDAIFFLQSEDVETAAHPLAWGLDSRVLRQNGKAGAALEVEAPSGWSAQDNIAFDQALEIIMLDGLLQFADSDLGKGDYLRLPAGKVIPAPASETGAKFLIFFEDGNPQMKIAENAQASSRGDWLLVRDADSPWVAGTVMEEAGRDDVPLKIKHYKNDPKTGARTYLVAVSPGVVIPWEVHTIAEEAYIVEGDYTLSECLPSGVQTGDYDQGGYFYRPAGIAHNGPASGTKTGVVMLIRTPGPLTVKLLDGCPYEN